MIDFKTQVKTRGRIQIPKIVMTFYQLEEGEWVEVSIKKIKPNSDYPSTAKFVSQKGWHNQNNFSKKGVW